MIVNLAITDNNNNQKFMQMKKNKILFPFLMVILIVSCNKFDTGYFEFKVDGELVKNDVLSYPLGYYDSMNDETNIEISIDLGAHAINIIVPGNTTGEFTINDDAYILYTKDGTTDFEAHNDMSGAVSLTVNITEYGKVGKYIIGTFSGELADANDNIVVISEGKFKVKREVDDY